MVSLAMLAAAGAALSVLVLPIARNIERSVGGEPEFAAQVARRIADGDLETEVRTRPETSRACCSRSRPISWR